MRRRSTLVVPFVPGPDNTGPSDPPATSWLGVPAVPTGLEFDQATPTLPDPWTSNTTGFYYVKQGGSNGGNGYPTSPRGSIPDPIPAGAVVVLDNTAALSVSSLSLTFNGTSGSRAWLIGSGQVGLGSGSSYAEVSHSGGVSVSGDYFFIDGIDFHASTSTNLVGFNTPTYALVRNIKMRANGAQAGNNGSNSIDGTSTSVRAHHVVFYNIDVYDNGAWDPVSLPSDIDVHGFQVNQWVEDVWILSSRFFHNQGDGIQFTGAGPANGVTDFRRVYVAGCTFYENLQAGCWTKGGSDLIFSQNVVYNQNARAGAGEGTGEPIGMGGQYDFNNLWYIANRIYDCDNSVRFAGANNGVSGQNLYLVGNVVTNTNASSGIQTGSPNSEGCAIAFWQGVNAYVIHNTIWKFTGHGVAVTPNSSINLRMENNIVAGRTNSSCFDVFMESYSTAPKIRNNSFPSSPRFSLNGATFTSVSALQSDDSTNRSNNLSGSVSFVSAVNGVGDFHVNSGDATVNAGAITSDVYATFLTNYGLDISKDFDGNARTLGGTTDIGAYERAS